MSKWKDEISKLNNQELKEKLKDLEENFDWIKEELYPNQEKLDIYDDIINSLKEKRKPILDMVNQNCYQFNLTSARIGVLKKMIKDNELNHKIKGEE